MLGLGIAASSAPSLFADKEHWQAIYEASSPDTADRQPFLREGESPDVVQTHIERAARAYAALRQELRRYQPDAVIVVAPGSLTAAFALGANNELSQRLQQGLVARGVDVVASTAGVNAVDEPARRLASLVERLLRESKAPVVPLLLNTEAPPLPSAARCWELGAAISAVAGGWPEKVAIVASGGLSYDALGRWVDEPFDLAVLASLQAGNADKLRRLFTFDSENFGGRTGEIRTWVVAAGACNGEMTLVDYFPSRQAKTGLAFAVWKTP